MKLLDSAIILASITAFLYSSSTAFTHGYFGILDLDSDVLDRNFHQILYHGMLLNLRTLVAVPLAIAILITLHSFYKISLSNYIHTSFANGRKLRNFKKKLNLRVNKKRPTIAKYEERANKFWLVFLSSFVFLLGMAVFESKSKAEAIKAIHRVNKETSNIVIVELHGTKRILNYLYCGARNCAAYDPETEQIIYFPQNGHVYIGFNKIKD